MRDLDNARVTVVYREFLDPTDDDPAHHIPGETYSVKNVEAALLFHPRAEIVAYEGSNTEPQEPVTTEAAKRHLAAWRRQQEEADEESKPAKAEPAKTDKAETDKDDKDK